MFQNELIRNKLIQQSIYWEQRRISVKSSNELEERKFIFSEAYFRSGILESDWLIALSPGPAFPHTDRICRSGPFSFTVAKQNILPWGRRNLLGYKILLSFLKLPEKKHQFKPKRDKLPANPAES